MRCSLYLRVRQRDRAGKTLAQSFKRSIKKLTHWYFTIRRAIFGIGLDWLTDLGLSYETQGKAGNVLALDSRKP